MSETDAPPPPPTTDQDVHDGELETEEPKRELTAAEKTDAKLKALGIVPKIIECKVPGGRPGRGQVKSDDI